MAHPCFPNSLRICKYKFLLDEPVKKLRTAYAALPFSVPSLSMKLTLVQDARKAHVCTKSIDSKMNIVLSISNCQGILPHSVKPVCATQENNFQVNHICKGKVLQDFTAMW